MLRILGRGRSVPTATELIFVEAQRFTNFAIKTIYALRTGTGSHNSSHEEEREDQELTGQYVGTTPSRSLAQRQNSFTHDHDRHTLWRTQKCIHTGVGVSSKVAYLFGDCAVFLVLARKNISCFMDVHMIHAVAYTTWLHGRVHPAFTEHGRRSLERRMLLQILTCRHLNSQDVITDPYIPTYEVACTHDKHSGIVHRLFGLVAPPRL
jgi:hypothetical protein